MSTVGQKTQQLQQDLQNELVTSNQLLRLISIELEQIKQFTRNGGEFETNLAQNASLIANLANMQQIDIEKLPPLKRINIDMSNNNITQNKSYEQHDSFRNESDMEESR